MKKSLALLLSLSLLVAIGLVGCSSDDGAVEIGLGSVTSIGSSRDADDDTTARAQADTTIAAVALDKDGKIVAVDIDVAQVRVDFDEDMEIASDVNAEVKTKKELEYDYDMLRVSEIEAEWFEQIAALEEWMIGQTVEEVLSMDVYERDPSHQHVPDVPELTSSVTITVEGYLAALEKAAENTIPVEDMAEFGLGHEISIAKSTESQAQMDITYAAAGFDSDGIVVGTIIDTAQVRVAYDEDGKVATEDAGFRTKKELRDDYNMRGRSEIDAEWFEQIEALEEWMVGKSISDITGMPVFERDASHQHVPDVPELTSTVTITVEGYQAAVAEAYDNKR